MKTRIAYTKPSITDLEVNYATDAARNGWGEKCYDYIVKFENAFRAHLGVKHVIATSSCTGALHMGFAAMGLTEGDEVILADTNWIATVSPLVHLGVKPIFVDILPDSWCLDPQLVEKAITKKTKAIIATHLYGNLAEMNALLEIGKKCNVPVIEDAAEAIGSVYHGKQAGSMGLFGTFSFHGTKTVTTGEGGMFVTNDDDLFEKVLTFSNHGRSRSQTKQFWPDVVGFKYKMSNIQAAIGLGQIERANELVERKRQIFAHYAQAFKGISGITMNPQPARCINGYWMPTLVFAATMSIGREKIFEAFKQESIDARVFFHPLSNLSMFEAKNENTISWEIPERAINLPSYHDMTNQELDRVIEVVLRLLKQQGKI